MDLVIDFQGASAEKMLGGIVQRLDNPGTLVSSLVNQLHAYERQVFSTSGFGKWPADDPATEAAKDSGRTLVNTGDLFKHLTSGTPMVEGESLVVEGPSYTGFLKRGTSKMPARDPAPVPSSPTLGSMAGGLLAYVVNGHRG